VEEKSADKPAAAPVKPAPVPGYQRSPNIREAYSRYNDVITATVMRDRAAVKELLDDGKNPNARQRDGFTPLMVAVANGDADIAGMLLAKGADPNLRSQSGKTALALARSRGAAGGAMVQMLQRSGAKE
jgi:ankyrin repeat protein